MTWLWFSMVPDLNTGFIHDASFLFNVKQLLSPGGESWSKFRLKISIILTRSDVLCCSCSALDPTPRIACGYAFYSILRNKRSLSAFLCWCRGHGPLSRMVSLYLVNTPKLAHIKGTLSSTPTPSVIELDSFAVRHHIYEYMDRIHSSKASNNSRIIICKDSVAFPWNPENPEPYN